MSVHSGWFNEEETIIIMKFEKAWSVSERKEAEQKVIQLASQTSTRFDMIVDYTRASQFVPTGTLKDWLRDATKSERTMPNLGITVFVTTSPTLQAYFEAGRELSSVIRKNSHLAQTLDDAVQLIVDDRASAS